MHSDDHSNPRPQRCRLMAILCMVGPVFRIIANVAWIAASISWRKRRAARRFYRDLRRAGLTESEASRLTESYTAGISLRGLLRRR